MNKRIFGVSINRLFLKNLDPMTRRTRCHSPLFAILKGFDTMSVCFQNNISVMVCLLTRHK